MDIARRLELTPAAMSRAVQRGEKIVKEEGYKIEERDSSQLTVVPRDNNNTRKTWEIPLLTEYANVLFSIRELRKENAP